MVYPVRGGANIKGDPILTNIAMGYDVGGKLIGEALFPAVTVKKRGGRYWDFGLQAFQTPFQGDLRAPGTEANEIPGITTSEDSFFCDEHALQHPVTDEEVEEYADTPLKPLQDGVELVTDNILMGRELAMRDLVYNENIYRTDHVTDLSGSPDDQFNDPDSDPIGVFRAAFATGHRHLFRDYNLAVIPYEVVAALEDHPQLLGRMGQNERQIMTPELLAQLLGLERVIVPGMGWNPNNNPGVAPADMDDIEYLWGKNILLAYVPPRPGFKVPAFGYEFVFPIAGQRMASDRWYEKKRKTTLVRVARRYDLKIVAKDAAGDSFAAHLIKGAVA